MLRQRPTKGSGEAAALDRIPYRCSLPGLTRFGSGRCTGPEPFVGHCKALMLRRGIAEVKNTCWRSNRGEAGGIPQAFFRHRPPSPAPAVLRRGNSRVTYAFPFGRGRRHLLERPEDQVWMMEA